MRHWHEPYNTVTILHGTSSACLDRIKQEGLRVPALSIDEYIRLVAKDYLPEERVTDELVATLKERGGWQLSIREIQLARDHALFVLPNYETSRAAGYAHDFYRHGGEFAYGVYDALIRIGEIPEETPPRYADAHPVVLEFEIPIDHLGEEELQHLRGLRHWIDQPVEGRFDDLNIEINSRDDLIAFYETGPLLSSEMGGGWKLNVAQLSPDYLRKVHIPEKGKDFSFSNEYYHFRLEEEVTPYDEPVVDASPYQPEEGEKADAEVNLDEPLIAITDEEINRDEEVAKESANIVQIGAGAACFMLALGAFMFGKNEEGHNQDSGHWFSVSNIVGAVFAVTGVALVGSAFHESQQTSEVER